MTPSARELLAAARAHYDDPGTGLLAAVDTLAPRGFAGGAEWMRVAFVALRGVKPIGSAQFQVLGARKYGLALLFAIVAGALLALISWWLVPLAAVVFYAVEVRMVFAFPCALDGSTRPLRDSHRLVASSITAPRATLIVMRIAFEMLIGGLCGRGFVRSWCVGCLAVVLWYEAARAVCPAEASA
ncbi:MAG: hypothetical protein NXI31_08310 [bacterium]|nr:hypothetical protein [bacterium]